MMHLYCLAQWCKCFLCCLTNHQLLVTEDNPFQHGMASGGQHQALVSCFSAQFAQGYSEGVDSLGRAHI
jgi:hypothetical protein